MCECGNWRWELTELLGQTGVDRVQSSHGLKQIFPPVFDLHCAFRLQDSASGQQDTHRQLWEVEVEDEDGEGEAGKDEEDLYCIIVAKPLIIYFFSNSQHNVWQTN